MPIIGAVLSNMTLHDFQQAAEINFLKADLYRRETTCLAQDAARKKKREEEQEKLEKSEEMFRGGA